MKQVFKLLAENFWVRNLAILTCLVILEQIFRPDKGLSKILMGGTITAALYLSLLFHNRILLDRFLLKRKYLVYGIGAVAVIIYYVLVMYSNSKGGYTKGVWRSGLSIAFFNTLAGTLFYFAFKYFREQQDFARNKIYLFEMEQKYLRNQLSPHFLFNTLNNIYSYSLVESKKTPELILKLSELMRYLTQFNKHDFISLKEEMSFIENYIAFERERLEDRCEIVFRKEIADSAQRIEPLLFFPLIENAFKHGTNTIEQCYVRLDICQEGKKLSVTIKNRITATTSASTHSGLENVEKRLMLFYPGSYKLDINEGAQEYIVNLSIYLNDKASWKN